MEVFTTRINENLFVFESTGMCITAINSEYIHDDFANKVKS